MTRTTLVPTRSSRVDPFSEFDTIVRRAFGTDAAPSGFHPAAEVSREGDDALVRLELPGLDVSRDVNVEVSEHRLVVSGERRDERADERRGYREFRYGSFRRSFRLPAHVTAEQVTASYDAGVLTLRITGANASAPAQQIAISTVSAQPAAEDVAEPATPGAGDAEQDASQES